MLKQMFGFLVYFFSVNPNILEVLIAWLLALVFAAIWVACYRPSLLAKPWLWAVFAGGAILAPIAIAVVVYPLTSVVSWAFGSIWSRETLVQWAILASVPSMYIYALVRVGFTLIPVVIYWWRSGRDIEPKLGLFAGAMSGAGFAWLESQWTLNYIFASGWTWEDVQMYGLRAFGGFWESFFVVGIQVASCALAGWGLAKGWGWQFYLLGAFVYFFSSYSYVLMSKELITGVQAEFFIAAWALIATTAALWLREKKITSLNAKT